MDESPLPPAAREPDFANLLAVLRRAVPARPTLYELFLNARLYRRFCEPGLLAGLPSKPGRLDRQRMLVSAYARAGFDYAHIDGPFDFPRRRQERGASISQNEGVLIRSRADFEALDWPNPDKCDYGYYDAIMPYLPPKMKLVSLCPSGVLENTISLVGYENLCLLVLDDPDLAGDIFDAVGRALLRHQEIVAAHPAVGAAVCNDDWGHRTQTMLSPEHMRRFVFPWHRRMVEAVHAQGKPAILHSCGNLERVMEDIIDIGFDAKHSYEDAICPVEEMYERWHKRIAVIGGMDLDFICRRPPAEVTARCRALLERTATRGGYALGTGNSVPEYVEDERFLAVTRAALEG